MSTKTKILPPNWLIEPSAGVDRGVFAVLTEAYNEETLPTGEKRTVLKLAKHLSPVKVAVIPLKRNNPDIMKKTHEIKDLLLKTGIGRIMLEDSGNIGKSYRRHDEIGTPFCVTVDFETLEKEPATVTIRDRDTMAQQRMPICELADYFKKQFV